MLRIVLSLFGSTPRCRDEGPWFRVAKCRGSSKFFRQGGHALQPRKPGGTNSMLALWPRHCRSETQEKPVGTSSLTSEKAGDSKRVTREMFCLVGCRAPSVERALVNNIPEVLRDR